VVALIASGLLSAQLALGTIGDRLNVALNFGTILIVVLVAIPLARSKRKDATIKDLNDALEAKDKRLEESVTDVAEAKQQARQIEQAAAHCRDEATAWRSKYEEQSKYTAPEAIAAFVEMAKSTERSHERRHKEVMAALEALTASVKHGRGP
jgi:ABC-type transport system involved in cytochrome bd biosynthesis fused ATPase/permease subunit